MDNFRSVFKILKSQPTTEGAGVRLKRVFGYHQVPMLDPFLLLDDFGSENPNDYLAGFPWHPHRGIETVTYMLRGEVEHSDSLGNTGVIQSGDVQWMTTGSGIIHQEMPKKFDGPTRGFQLWVNLPSSHKMMEPRYRELKQEQIPIVDLTPGVQVKIICGELEGREGPVRDIVVDVQYFDFTLAPQTDFETQVKSGYKAFAYVIEGEGYFEPEKSNLIKADHLVVYYDEGTKIKLSSNSQSLRFLFFSGKPLKEIVAWAGPIVMNSQKDLRLAFQEYRDGTFIKSK